MSSYEAPQNLDFTLFSSDTKFKGPLFLVCAGSHNWSENHYALINLLLRKSQWHYCFAAEWSELFISIAQNLSNQNVTSTTINKNISQIVFMRLIILNFFEVLWQLNCVYLLFFFFGIENYLYKYFTAWQFFHLNWVLYLSLKRFWIVFLLLYNIMLWAMQGVADAHRSETPSYFENRIKAGSVVFTTEMIC